MDATMLLRPSCSADPRTPTMAPETRPKAYPGSTQPRRLAGSGWIMSILGGRYLSPGLVMGTSAMWIDGWNGSEPQPGGFRRARLGLWLLPYMLDARTPGRPARLGACSRGPVDDFNNAIPSAGPSAVDGSTGSQTKIEATSSRPAPT